MNDNRKGTVNSKLANSGQNKRRSSFPQESPSKRRRKSESEPPRLKGDYKDIFCWKCHKFGTDMVSCDKCPRVFHFKCSLLEKRPSSWSCYICEDLRKYNANNRPAYLKNLTQERFSELLLFVLNRMRENDGSMYFENPVDLLEYPEYKLYIVKSMCLGDMEYKIKCRSYYSCEQFIADTRWIVHNCYVFNSAHSELVPFVRSIGKVAKAECDEIVNCCDCYFHGNVFKEDEWFIEACSTPHVLVWAKLGRCPYWPAKVIDTIGNEVHVRFFGDHSRATIASSFCLLFTKHLHKPKKKDDKLEISFQEIMRHIEKLEARFGDFCHHPTGIAFDPKNEKSQRHFLLPKMKLEETVSGKSSDFVKKIHHPSGSNSSGCEERASDNALLDEKINTSRPSKMKKVRFSDEPEIILINSRSSTLLNKESSSPSSIAPSSEKPTKTIIKNVKPDKDTDRSEESKLSSECFIPLKKLKVDSSHTYKIVGEFINANKKVNVLKKMQPGAQILSELKVDESPPIKIQQKELNEEILCVPESSTSSDLCDSSCKTTIILGTEEYGWRSSISLEALESRPDKSETICKLSDSSNTLNSSGVTKTPVNGSTSGVLNVPSSIDSISPGKQVHDFLNHLLLNEEAAKKNKILSKGTDVEKESIVESENEITLPPSHLKETFTSKKGFGVPSSEETPSHKFLPNQQIPDVSNVDVLSSPAKSKITSSNGLEDFANCINAEVPVYSQNKNSIGEGHPGIENKAATIAHDKIDHAILDMPSFEIGSLKNSGNNEEVSKRGNNIGCRNLKEADCSPDLVATTNLSRSKPFKSNQSWKIPSGSDISQKENNDMIAHSTLRIPLDAKVSSPKYLVNQMDKRFKRKYVGQDGSLTSKSSLSSANSSKNVRGRPGELCDPIIGSSASSPLGQQTSFQSQINTHPIQVGKPITILNSSQEQYASLLHQNERKVSCYRIENWSRSDKNFLGTNYISNRRDNDVQSPLPFQMRCNYPGLDSSTPSFNKPSTNCQSASSSGISNPRIGNLTSPGQLDPSSSSSKFPMQKIKSGKVVAMKAPIVKKEKLKPPRTMRIANYLQTLGVPEATSYELRDKILTNERLLIKIQSKGGFENYRFAKKNGSFIVHKVSTGSDVFKLPQIPPWSRKKSRKASRKENRKKCFGSLGSFNKKGFIKPPQYSDSRILSRSRCNLRELPMASENVIVNEKTKNAEVLPANNNYAPAGSIAPIPGTSKGINSAASNIFRCGTAQDSLNIKDIISSSDKLASVSKSSDPIINNGIPFETFSPKKRLVIAYEDVISDKVTETCSPVHPKKDIFADKERKSNQYNNKSCIEKSMESKALQDAAKSVIGVLGSNIYKLNEESFRAPVKNYFKKHDSKPITSLGVFDGKSFSWKILDKSRTQLGKNLSPHRRMESTDLQSTDVSRDVAGNSTYDRNISRLEAQNNKTDQHVNVLESSNGDNICGNDYSNNAEANKDSALNKSDDGSENGVGFISREKIPLTSSQNDTTEEVMSIGRDDNSNPHLEPGCQDNYQLALYKKLVESFSSENEILKTSPPTVSKTSSSPVSFDIEEPNVSSPVIDQEEVHPTEGPPCTESIITGDLDGKEDNILHSKKTIVLPESTYISLPESSKNFGIRDGENFEREEDKGPLARGYYKEMNYYPISNDSDTDDDIDGDEKHKTNHLKYISSRKVDPFSPIKINDFHENIVINSRTKTPDISSWLQHFKYFPKSLVKSLEPLSNSNVPNVLSEMGDNTSEISSNCITHELLEEPKAPVEGHLSQSTSKSDINNGPVSSGSLVADDEVNQSSRNDGCHGLVDLTQNSDDSDDSDVWTVSESLESKKLDNLESLAKKFDYFVLHVPKNSILNYSNEKYLMDELKKEFMPLKETPPDNEKNVLGYCASSDSPVSLSLSGSVSESVAGLTSSEACSSEALSTPAPNSCNAKENLVTPTSLQELTKGLVEGARNVTLLKRNEIPFMEEGNNFDIAINKANKATNEILDHLMKNVEPNDIFKVVKNHYLNKIEEAKKTNDHSTVKIYERKLEIEAEFFKRETSINELMSKVDYIEEDRDSELMTKLIADTKKTTWCSNCFSKKASVFCCAYASYCSATCKEAHFCKHSKKCFTLDPKTSYPLFIHSNVDRMKRVIHPDRHISVEKFFDVLDAVRLEWVYPSTDEVTPLSDSDDDVISISSDSSDEYDDDSSGELEGSGSNEGSSDLDENECDVGCQLPLEVVINSSPEKGSRVTFEKSERDSLSDPKAHKTLNHLIEKSSLPDQLSQVPREAMNSKVSSTTSGSLSETPRNLLTGHTNSIRSTCYKKTPNQKGDKITLASILEQPKTVSLPPIPKQVTRDFILAAPFLASDQQKIRLPAQKLSLTLNRKPLGSYLVISKDQKCARIVHSAGFEKQASSISSYGKISIPKKMVWEIPPSRSVDASQTIISKDKLALNPEGQVPILHHNQVPVIPNKQVPNRSLSEKVNNFSTDPQNLSSSSSTILPSEPLLMQKIAVKESHPTKPSIATEKISGNHLVNSHPNLVNRLKRVSSVEIKSKFPQFCNESGSMILRDSIEPSKPPKGLNNIQSLVSKGQLTVIPPKSTKTLKASHEVKEGVSGSNQPKVLGSKTLLVPKTWFPSITVDSNKELEDNPDKCVATKPALPTGCRPNVNQDKANSNNVKLVIDQSDLLNFKKNKTDSPINLPLTKKLIKLKSANNVEIVVPRSSVQNEGKNSAHDTQAPKKILSKQVIQSVRPTIKSTIITGTGTTQNIPGLIGKTLRSPNPSGSSLLLVEIPPGLDPRNLEFKIKCSKNAEIKTHLNPFAKTPADHFMANSLSGPKLFLAKTSSPRETPSSAIRDSSERDKNE